MKTATLLRNISGATALEFALTAPIFFGLILGIGTIGIGLYTKVALQHAVERAARCRALSTTTCNTVDATKTYARNQSYGLSPPTSTFTVTTPACGVRVQASYPVTMSIASLGRRTVTLTASSCFPT